MPSGRFSLIAVRIGYVEMYDVKTGFTHEPAASENYEWYTPRQIFDALGLEFDLDVCSPGADIVSWIPADRHLTIMEDGLKSEWKGRCWCNPPYGKETGLWLSKLRDYGNGIALVMSRTDTRWFHANVPYAEAVCFLDKRISFVPWLKAAEYAEGSFDPRYDYWVHMDGRERKGNAGAGSILVGYGKDNVGPIMNCGLGWCVKNSRARSKRVGSLFERAGS